MEIQFPLATRKGLFSEGTGWTREPHGCQEQWRVGSWEFSRALSSA